LSTKLTTPRVFLRRRVQLSGGDGVSHRGTAQEQCPPEQ
jgi:hypothetical protein